MVRIFPLAAIRPTQQTAAKVVARILGTETDEQLRVQLNENPYSYLNLVKPHIHLGEPANQSLSQYQFALKYFDQMIQDQVLVKDSEPAVYIYKQSMADGHSFLGIIAGVSAIDYLEGIIKKHENTITAKEEKMVVDISSTSVVGEPVLLSCPNGQFLENWTIQNSKGIPLLNFYDGAGLQHEIWPITDSEAIAVLVKDMLSQDALYIADGHHRIAASSDYLTRMHNEHNWTGKKMAFMAFILPEHTLWIKSFHRLITGLTDAEIRALIEGAKEKFEIEYSLKPVLPKEKGEFGLCTRLGWYKLRFLEDAEYSSPAQNLDVSRLEKYIFHNVLNIKDSKTDSRLQFVRGDMSAGELEALITSGSIDAAFLVHPNSMEEIKAVADADETMPPKSTWIEPKLLTGMIIQQFS